MELIADTYVGYGGDALESDINMDFSRLFIQPGFNLSTPYFDAGLHTRFVGIKYRNLNDNGRGEEYVRQHGLEQITGTRHFFFEPALTLRGATSLSNYSYSWSAVFRWTKLTGITTRPMAP